VDPRLHHLQREAELVKPTDRLALLQQFFREKSALYRRHQAGAQQVSAYDSNNAYQYVLERESAHLDWLRSAIGEAGGVADDSAGPLVVPAGRTADGARTVADDDARTAGEFLARWQPRVGAMTQARDRKMLELILGEVGEHQRFFAQAAASRTDLLGRRPEGAGTGGGVLPQRWVE
jgi:hypothetical protein